MSDLADWLAAQMRAHTMPISRCKCGWRCEDEYSARYALTAAHQQHQAAAASEAFLGLPLQERARLAGIELKQQDEVEATFDGDGVERMTDTFESPDHLARWIERCSETGIPISATRVIRSRFVTDWTPVPSPPKTAKETT